MTLAHGPTVPRHEVVLQTACHKHVVLQTIMPIARGLTAAYHKRCLTDNMPRARGLTDHHNTNEWSHSSMPQILTDSMPLTRALTVEGHNAGVTDSMPIARGLADNHATSE